MKPTWRLVTRTVGITFTITSLFWLVIAAWWYQRMAPGRDAERASAAQSASLKKSVSTGRVSAASDPGSLTVPVVGVQPSQLVDTFAQAREAGARHHDAIDILAPRGTPVIASAAGRVEKLLLSKDGGNTVYVRSRDGRHLLYYAHLDRYAAGLAEGAVVERGAPIGSVGSTGNADPAAPHLHFAVWATAPDAKWWEPHSTLNPYPLLVKR